ncbi:LysR family transcriptional regulator [Enterobacter roggenkampii]|uniref:LysR family transcriptional regulator n=1 Tax=Enterobacter roggenkampii TaxID=1812935 RepID=UPI002237E0B8|nr:LysR family transcriptional regulator [Enterobacter roggenkampii]MCW5004213.1 LysR family transcriptional regulator [Enterobacter roggenkampii]
MYKHFQGMALFASLIEAGSFTEVANRLDLSKSRVSQRIQALEAHLGIRLLNRTTRRLSLTSAGDKYLVYCKQLLAIETEAYDLMQIITGLPAGKLRIIAPAGLMMASLIK